MKLEAFFERFDQFADAPDAVAKMRELVLRMATSGRIAEQDPNDQPGGELLKEIFAVRDNLIKRGAAKNRAEGNPITAGDTIDLPPSWSRCMISEVCDLQTGATPSRMEHSYFGGDIPWLVSGDINKGEITESDGRITEEGLENSNCKIIPANSVLIALNGQGKTRATVALLRMAAALNQSLVAMIPYAGNLLLPEYIFWNLRGRYYAIRDITGQDQRRGLNMKLVGQLSLPIPPLAEQRRIVVKVDELMALCDRLEAQQQERETRHAALARASLARFADAPTPANLNFLFHPSYAIPPADLRKSILTLAVQGKLVPQDPNDEPAEELLARLELGRANIAKEQGVRTPKNVPPFTADHYPHDIPESWKWSKIGHLALVIDYGTSQKADDNSSKVPVYRMGNIVGGRLVDGNLKYVDASIDDLPGLYLKTDDILFNRTNSYELVGKAGIYTGPDDTATFASYLIRIRLPNTFLFPTFFSIAMNAPYFRQTQIEPEVVQQCGQANFNGTKLASTVVPVPPLAEQRRIVAKVEQLMALVDALETQLAASRTTGADLMEAVVVELTAEA